MEPTITIRINHKDWKALRRLFPGEKGESVAHYLERYVKALREMER